MKSFSRLRIIVFTLLFSTIQIAFAKDETYTANPPRGKTSLLTSYLPPSMQVIHYITMQMQFEIPVSSDEIMSSSTMASNPSTTTQKTTTSRMTTTTKRSTTMRTTTKPESTTQSHKPAIFAPLIPPKPERIAQPLKAVEEEILPPIVDDKESSYSHTLLMPYDHSIPVIEPDYSQKSPEYVKHSELQGFPVLFASNSYAYAANPAQLDEAGPLFLPGNYQPDPSIYADFSPIARSDEKEGIILDDDIKALPDISSLPLQNENNFKANPLEIEPEELSEDNLQYLSPVIKEILRKERDFKDEERYNDATMYQTVEETFNNENNKNDWLRIKKNRPTQVEIQLLLLYDLLSRDAKKQKLNSYHGYTDEMIKDLIETSKGTVIDQLKTVLERMVARGDCTHDFANNRAKEVIDALGKPESNLNKEIRYLKPLRFTK